MQLRPYERRAPEAVLVKLATPFPLAVVHIDDDELVLRRGLNEASEGGGLLRAGPPDEREALERPHRVGVGAVQPGVRGGAPPQPQRVGGRLGSAPSRGVRTARRGVSGACGEPRRRPAVEVAVELVPVVGSEGGGELFHPCVGKLGEARVERIHPPRGACLRDVRVCEDTLEADGHVALEPRQLARESQLARPRHDLLLHVVLLAHEGARQRACDPRAVLILPAGPRQEGGAVEPAADLEVGEPERAEHAVLHFFLPGQREEEVDSGESHPVEHLLPLAPIVPDKRIGVRAHIHKVRVRRPATASHGSARCTQPRPGFRDGEARSAATRPADGHVRVLAQVVAYARSDQGHIGRHNGELVRVRRIGEGEAAILGAGEAEGEVRR
mmetsp:Transcript_41853/g.104024  ORF Transcript_41853/g.104024 Transcript_41853/m.104024 type:complete len:385 (-) Transcript_41853:130-1284(-)